MVRIETAPAKSVRIPALATIAAKLEAMVDAARPFGSAEDVRDVKLALASLMLACQTTLDDLAAIGGRANLADMAIALGAPPIAGGSPEACECEECRPWDGDCDYDAPGDEWPAEYVPELDGFVWNPTDPQHDGPLPLSVLEKSAPPEAARFVPTIDDWNDYHAWCVDQGYGVGERDLIAAGLPVG